jgi:hypothetical protein
MPDTKITALTAIGANPIIPATFPIPMVDLTDTSMAASGTTKKVTVNQILGAGGTATLASATITGDLTVDTNVLKVDTTNDRVGIGTASPSGILHAANLGTAGTTADNFNGYFSSANRNANLYLLAKNTEGSNFYFGDGDSNTVGGIIYDHASNYMRFDANGSERMRIDSSGNVGVGVTPSAWVAGAKALQFGAYGALAQSSSGNIELSFNSYNSGAGAYKYLQTDTASLYRASSVHSWFVAPSGTAGNVITYTQAMTLDASGNLLVGTTSLIAGSASGSLNIVGANTQQIQIRNSSATAGEYWRQAVDSSNTIYILNNASTGVSITSGATSWSAVSDERLKDIIEPIGNAVAKVGSLRSVIGKYKTDSEGTRRSFLIAQDVQSVLPEAVDTTNADAFGVRYSEVIPLLVAAIKELTARVQTLETR